MAVPPAQTREPVSQSRVHGQAGDPLGDADGEGIEEGPGEPGRRADEAHGHAGDRIVAERQRQRHEDEDEGHGLFAHAPDAAPQGKDEHDHRDEQHAQGLFPAELEGDVADDGGDGPRLLDDVEGAADDEQDGDDGRGVHEAADGRQEQTRKPLRMADDTGIGPGHGDGPAVLHDPLILAARDDPGGDHGQDDHDVDEDERVRQAEGLAFHFDGSSTRPAARS